MILILAFRHETMIFVVGAHVYTGFIMAKCKWGDDDEIAQRLPFPGLKVSSIAILDLGGSPAEHLEL